MRGLPLHVRFTLESEKSQSYGYTPDGRLRYAGRVGTGITVRELKRLADVLRPLQTPSMPLAEPPPRDSRFGSPLQLSRVHWVRPQIVVDVTYLTWTKDNLLGACSLH